MANKKINIVFDASMEIGQIKTAVSNIQKSLEGVSLPKNISSDFNKVLGNLNKEILKFEQETSKSTTGQLNFDALTKSGNKVLALYQDLQVAAKQLGNLSDKQLANLFPKDISDNIQKAQTALEKYNTSLANSQKEEKSKREELEKTEKAIQQINKEIDTLKNKKVVSDKQFDSLRKSANDASDEVTKIKNKLEELNQEKVNKESTLVKPMSSSSYRNLIKEIEEYEKKLIEAQNIETQVRAEKNSSIKESKYSQDLEKQTQKLTEQTQKYNELQKAISTLTSSNNGNLTALFNVLGQIPGIDLSKFSRDAEGAAQIIATLQQQGLVNVTNGFNNITTAVDNASGSFGDYKNKVDQAADSQKQFDDRMRDVSALKSRIQYFFGINNAINLVRRALSSAYQAVKELDEAMTQTAVVTDFTVGDMWKTLPEYTARANQLGTTIKGVYEASTLYYQQGLKTEEVIGVSTETLKMAKIAGLDYADATDFMTAALRGFNMEVNELNATKVNDIYSKLAAITAADTEEIASAMTKTASIASNANMEIETTAAFLSQIIETTRESAETAGTAMKTVIARFQELKKDPSEIGEVDGEIVDANKIETALRSVGVALRDSNGQFRDLDDVFLELSKKWQSLDTNTQRYIATIAAGSRQQSRFIAMMSNYERTMELVTAANNSAGASQEQFEKTLDSLESKVNQLKNSWNEFVLGITNNEVIKTGIDLLTLLLNTINKLTDAFGSTGGAFAKFLTAFAAFKAGKYMFGANGIAAMFGGKSAAEYRNAGEAAAGKFVAGFQGGISGKIKNIGKAFKGQIDPLQWTSFNSGNLGGITDIKGSPNFKALTNAYRNGDIKGAEEALKNLNVDAKTTNSILGDMQRVADAPAQNLKTIASSAQAAGMAMFFLSNAIPDSEELAPFKKGITTIASILMGFGTLMSVTIPLMGQQMITKLNATLASNPYLLLIGVAITAAIGLFTGLSEAIETTAEKQERLAKQTEEAARKTSELTEEYNKLTDTIENLDKAEKTLDTLIEGSDAWKDKVEEINKEMLELVRLYPQLKKYLKLGTDGLYTWTDEGAALDELTRARQEAKNESLAIEAGLAQETLDTTLSTRNTFTAEIKPSDPFTYYDETTGTTQYTETPVTGKITSTQTLSESQLLAIAEGYASNKSIFGSRENFEEVIGADKGFSEDFLNNLGEFEDQLIPILEEILDAQQVAEQTKDNYLTAVLGNNKDFANSENKDYVRDRIKNSESYKNFEQNYNTDEEIIARTKKDLETQEYKNVKVSIGANGEVTYSYDNGEKHETGSKGAKETVATTYAMEDYSKSGQLSTDIKKFEEQRQDQIDKIAQSYINIGVEETLARITAEEMVDEAAASGQIRTSGILSTQAIETGQLLEHLDISKLQALNEQLDKATPLGRAVANALESVRKSNLEANKSFDQEEAIEERLTKAYELFNLTGQAAETYKEKVAEETGLEGEALDLAIAAKLEFEWSDDQIDEIYEEVMAAFKMDDTDPRKFQAFESLLTPLKKILNNENLTVDFIIENQKEIQNFLNGVDGSLEELKAKSVLTLYADGSPARKVVERLISDLDNKEIKIGVKLYASNLPSLKELNKLIAQGDMTIQDATATLFGLGYSVDTFKATRENKNTEKGYEYYSQIGSITPWASSSNEPKYTPPEKKEEKAWENPYDKQYNYLEKINELLRQREKLEDNYQRAQAQGVAEYKATAAYYDQLFDSFEAEKAARKELLESYEEDYDNFINNNQQFKDLASYDKEKGVIHIEWEEIDKLEAAAKEQGETLEKEIAELERLQEGLEKTSDEISKVDTQRAEAERELKDAYLAFEERLAAALENIARKELEDQQKLFDSLTQAESALVDALNKNVDELRLARENEEKQQEIADKERRLAYLKQDTTGANNLEIKRLEKEIGQEKEDYRDTLLDQSLEELQKQNEAAANQREQQIALMESQIEYAVENGLYNKQAAQMLEQASKTGFAYDKPIWDALYKGENWSSKTSAGLRDVQEEVRDQMGQVAQAIKYLADKLGLDTGGTSIGNGSDGGGSGGGGSGGRKTSPNNSAPEYGIADTFAFTGNGIGEGTVGSDDGITYAVYDENQNYMGTINTQTGETHINGSGGHQEAYMNAAHTTLEKEKGHSFKTGGLADFTGPAWLDGSKSRPELVLNAQDTENFIMLKDVLSGLLSNAPGANLSGGDNYFDIDVNVEEIGSDYDVDQMAERIKQNIYQDGMYRNVNTINLLR